VGKDQAVRATFAHVFKHFSVRFMHPSWAVR